MTGLQVVRIYIIFFNITAIFHNRKHLPGAEALGRGSHPPRCFPHQGADPPHPEPCLRSEEASGRPWASRGFVDLLSPISPAGSGQLNTHPVPLPAAACGKSTAMGSGRRAAGWGNPKGRLPPSRSWGFLSLSVFHSSAGAEGPGRQLDALQALPFPLPEENVLKAAAELCTHRACWVVCTLVKEVVNQRGSKADFSHLWGKLAAHPGPSYK